MMTYLVGVIQGQDLVMAVLTLIIFGIIVGVLLWLVDYCKIQEPINRVIKVIIAILTVLILISALLSLIGKPLIVW